MFFYVCVEGKVEGEKKTRWKRKSLASFVVDVALGGPPPPPKKKKVSPFRRLSFSLSPRRKKKTFSALSSCNPRRGASARFSSRQLRQGRGEMKGSRGLAGAEGRRREKPHRSFFSFPFRPCSLFHASFNSRTCIRRPANAASETPSNARACLSSPADWSQSATEEDIWRAERGESGRKREREKMGLSNFFLLV